MRIFTAFPALLLTLFIGSAALAQQAAPAAQELAGTWQGKLQVDPKTSMTIQFVFARKPDGTYSAVLNSPDSGNINNLAADSVSWKAGALSLQVPSLSGSFAGTLSGGSISGQWKQPGGALPLVLTPYQKAQLSKAAVATLTGAWNGPLGVPQPLTFLMEFKPDDKGQLIGTLKLAEVPVQIPPFSDIQFSDNKLVAKVQMPGGVPAEFTATYANGALTGVWRAGNPLAPPAGVPLVLKKGTYVAQVHVLKLTSEDFGKLAGIWNGTLQATGPQGPVTIPIVLRFETNKSADMVGFMDIPSQKLVGAPMTEATVVAGKVTIKMAPLGEYDATLAGNTMTGQMVQGPQSLPLTMTRK